MTGDLTASFAKLKKSSDELNALTDKANETVRRVEKFLVNECRAGTETKVLTGATIEGRLEYLGYIKHNGSFRIVVVLEPGGTILTSGQNITLWGECNRDRKLRTIRALPDLVSDIQVELDNRINEASDAIATLHDALPLLADEED